MTRRDEAFCVLDDDPDLHEEVSELLDEVRELLAKLLKMLDERIAIASTVEPLSAMLGEWSTSFGSSFSTVRSGRRALDDGSRGSVA